jgi:hypothetical protein
MVAATANKEVAARCGVHVHIHTYTYAHSRTIRTIYAQVSSSYAYVYSTYTAVQAYGRYY